MVGKKDTEGRSAVTVDQISKVVFSEVRVLAEFVREVIPEFGMFTTERIMEAIRKRKEYPRGLNTENVLPGMDLIRYDLLYRIPVPDSGKEVSILVNIETQSRVDPGYSLDKRSLFYLTSVFSSQKGEVFRHSDYDSLETVYTVWVVLNPPEDLKGVIRRGRFGYEDTGPDGRRPVETDSMINSIMLFMCDEGVDNPLRVMDLLRTLLRKHDRDTIAEDVRNNFKIELNDDYIQEVSSMGEIADGFIQVGMDRERARFISVMVEAVVKLMNRSFSLEESLELVSVPEDCIEEVRAGALARTGNESFRTDTQEK